MLRVIRDCALNGSGCNYNAKIINSKIFLICLRTVRPATGLRLRAFVRRFQNLVCEAVISPTSLLMKLCAKQMTGAEIEKIR